MHSENARGFENFMGSSPAPDSSPAAQKNAWPGVFFVFPRPWDRGTQMIVSVIWTIPLSPLDKSLQREYDKVEK